MAGIILLIFIRKESGVTESGGRIRNKEEEKEE